MWKQPHRLNNLFPFFDCADLFWKLQDFKQNQALYDRQISMDRHIDTPAGLKDRCNNGRMLMLVTVKGNTSVDRESIERPHVLKSKKLED